MLKHITAGCVAIMLGALTLPALAAFDPVNDDTDIFLANPSITAERPNVLIILDNTANWNSAFTNEKSALVTVINGLNDSYNVGLMMFPETGGGNDSVDGGYMKFHVRQMNATNKNALATIVNNLDKLADKGNNATTGLAMYEAYLYYAGKASLASYGKVKTDFAGNTTNNPLSAALSGNHALDASPTSASLYHSPVVDGCQKNFIIYISNGPASENASARSALQGYLTTLLGTAPSTIAISPNGQQGNWADEVAQYMRSADVNTAVANTQNVTTYTVEVNPGTTGQGPDMTALLKSMADGGSHYFAVTDSASGVGIVDALNQIFTEVQAVNSVFAATTLPVSVNVRGTNLNQVYFGVFRPDSSKAPRWMGNLKLYDLKLDTTSNTVYLADSLGNVAQDTSTGFINSSRTSFWTSSSLAATNFWSFRTAAQNSVGGGSDAPDGELVEKGGAAQQDRHYFATDQSTRNLYTCTTGGSLSDCTPCIAAGSGTAKTCSGGKSLSATPFSTTNSAIDASALNLNTQLVASLTGKYSVAITALTDRKSASLTNIGAGTTSNVSTINTGATSYKVSGLTSAAPITFTGLSGISSATGSVNIVSISAAGLVTYSSSATLPSGFANGSTVTISGAVVSSGAEKWNGGPYTVSSLNTSAHTFNLTPPSGAKAETGGSFSTTNSFNTSTVTATTATPHGFLSGQTVTISGAASGFNSSSCPSSTCNITVTGPTTFTYAVISAVGNAATLGTVSANSQVITVTTSAAHTLTAGNTVVISNASPSGYNGSYTVIGSASTVSTLGKDSSTNFSNVTGFPAIGSTSFTLIKATNDSTTLLGPNSATPVYVAKSGTGGTALTVTTSASHGFLVSDSVTISGASVSQYNGICIVGSVTTTTFTCSTFTPTSGALVAPMPTDTAGTAIATTSTTNSNLVTATVTAHGFSTGNSITIESVGGADTYMPGTYNITKVDANHFTFDLSSTKSAPYSAPTGSYTARLASPIAYATAPAHGFGVAGATVSNVTISDATPAAYNVTPVTITVVDADNFTYPLSSAPGAATTTGTASINTTTAHAVAINHGFTSGATVTIGGATPSVFNGTFSIAVVDANNFTYTLPSAQGDATGTITAVASGAGSTAVANLINWVRGQDNYQDENKNSLLTDVRASIHGDVLHSRPAVINYNRFGGDNDVYVFYGANDGVFHAIKAGITTDSGDTSGLTPGQEAWGFVPTEFFSNLQRLRNNSPMISSSFKKPYFADGPIGTLTVDGDAVGTSGYGKLGGSADTVNLYIAMRRGGRFVYALDVNNPADPKLLWKVSNSTTGFSELGQTWSEPKVVPRDPALGCSFNGYSNPVVIFGAGYDPAVEDVDPATITAATSTSVTSSSVGIKTRSMGRGIYVVDAITGQLVVSIGGTNSNGVNKTVSGMDYAIPSDATVIRNESGGCVNRAYVGDTGGNLWRLDFGATYNSASPGDWVTVTKIASIGTDAAISTSISSHNPLVTTDLRKFLFPPDVVAQAGFDAVLIGSGDREHPFDATVVNRMYMFKDRGNDLGPYTGTTRDDNGDGVVDHPTITESGTALLDVTNDCLQVTTGACSGTTVAAQSALLNSSDGWFITLASGEKVIGNAVALAGTVFFNTNQPSASAGGGSCGSNLGIARQYEIAIADATATTGSTAVNRYKVNVAGGYLPSPVHAVVQFTDADGNTETKDVVIFGPNVVVPPQTPIGTRYRKYWWKEIDQ